MSSTHVERVNGAKVTPLKNTRCIEPVGPAEPDAEVAATEIVIGPPVDKPTDDTPPMPGHVQLEPIVPTWLRNRDDLKAALASWARLTWYRVRRHAWLTPVYAARVLRWAPIGVARLAARVARWALDTESAPLRISQIASGQAQAYMALE